MSAGDAPPLIALEGIRRVYASGDSELVALDGVSLEIRAGEFIALVGPSGCGKSTLMQILGCLDRPSSGRYRINGADVGALGPDALAALRRDTFGFVFQRYHLLPGATAAENVEIPAVYAGLPAARRQARALELLARLGLGERSGHRPSQLSGGQQQRVSIARALMNDAPVILADEPTGALDSRSGQEVLALLEGLHREGRTIVLITHDPAVAARAQRVVRLHDGAIVEDSGLPAGFATPGPSHVHSDAGHLERGWLADLQEAVKMATAALRTNLFRTTLTLLGVVIGVAAVVAMLAIGAGSKQDVLQRISAMGTQLLSVRPGAPGVRASEVATLVPADAEAIRQLPHVQAVSPERSRSLTLRQGGQDYRTQVSGVWPDYVHVRDWPLAEGVFFSREDLRSHAPVMVLGQTAAKNLFPRGEPIGKYVLVNNVPFEVIGLLSARGASPMGSDQDDVAFVPLSTGFMRLFGKAYLNNITVKVDDVARMDATQEAITALLAERHRTRDFQIRNTASLMEMATATQNTLTTLLGSVAAISLLVGGIGVMNIMLVNVTERTREIGIRMATGARMGNILLQFNTEAVVVCGIGGLLGVGLGLLVSYALSLSGMTVVYSAGPPLLAFSCAFLTGVLFGYLPARQAARMDPVTALASE